VNSQLISMAYNAGSPCASIGFHQVLDLARSSDEPAIPGLLSDTFSSVGALMP
jgi:hypothetical protein